MAGSTTQTPLKSQQKCVAVFALVCCCAVLVALIFSAVDLWGDEEDSITEDNCSRDCGVSLVETLPLDLPLPAGRGPPPSLPLSLGLHALLGRAQRSLEVVSPGVGADRPRPQPPGRRGAGRAAVPAACSV
ncbi:unnamed protein product [Gadus morhua 'NCC']